MGLVVPDKRCAGGCYAVCLIGFPEIKAAQVQTWEEGENRDRFIFLEK